MTVTKEINGEKLYAAISGRLDTTTAPQLEKELEEVSGAITELVIDMKELEYISSAGLRVLLALQKTMNTKGSMIIKNVNECVNEVFEITGFSDILTIE